MVTEAGVTWSLSHAGHPRWFLYHICGTWPWMTGTAEDWLGISLSLRSFPCGYHGFLTAWGPSCIVSDLSQSEDSKRCGWELFMTSAYMLVSNAALLWVTGPAEIQYVREQCQDMRMRRHRLWGHLWRQTVMEGKGQTGWGGEAQKRRHIHGALRWWVDISQLKKGWGRERRGNGLQVERRPCAKTWGY